MLKIEIANMKIVGKYEDKNKTNGEKNNPERQRPHPDGIKIQIGDIGVLELFYKVHGYWAPLSPASSPLFRLSLSTTSGSRILTRISKVLPCSPNRSSARTLVRLGSVNL